MEDVILEHGVAGAALLLCVLGGRMFLQRLDRLIDVVSGFGERVSSLESWCRTRHDSEDER